MICQTIQGTILNTRKEVFEKRRSDIAVPWRRYIRAYDQTAVTRMFREQIPEFVEIFCQLLACYCKINKTLKTKWFDYNPFDNWELFGKGKDAWWQQNAYDIGNI